MLQRILIIDDSLPIHKLIGSQLESEDIQTHSAYDGATGIAMALELHPRVILLDVDMPDLDGFEVCRRLKANPITESIPVIFLTADFALGDRIKGLDLGAVDYVTKPYKPEELSARVRAALRAKSMLEQKAMTDELTGLWNKKYLENQLTAQTSLAQRIGASMSCIALDVDGLHQINKKHGDAFGDEVLRSISGIIQRQCRIEDSVCHYGGGTFVIVMPAISRAGAARLADRLRSTIQHERFTHGGSEAEVTCSFGVMDSVVANGKDVLERTLAAMVRAKKNGGNCVSTARPSRKEAIAA